MTAFALTTGSPDVVDVRLANGTDMSLTPVNLATGVAIDQLTGDVLAGPGSGSQAATVVKVNGAAVPAGGALTTGNVPQVTGASTLGYAPVNLAGGANFVTGTLPAGNQAAQALAGDVTGTTAASIVGKINGTTVPAGGALTTGNVPQVTGAGALSYAPVNLAGGANFVTGTLPAGNQAAQALAGDVTGTTAASVVGKINGTTVPAGGALTTGNVPQVTGAGALSYAPVNLAGGANFVTGVLPAANLPVPGTSAYNPAWYAATDIYWDPVSGNDANSGTAIGAPVLTWAEIIRRYGSTSPQFNYGQTVTVHQLSAQPANQDPVFFTPLASGGGSAVLLGTLAVKSAAFVGGAVTAKVLGGPGTRLSVTGFPAGTAAGDYVFNQTRGSYAPVDSVSGGGVTVTMTQPIPTANLSTVAVPTFAQDNTWATGDTYVVYTRPNCNLKRWRPMGGDIAVGGAGGAGWVQWVSIPDNSTGGLSVYVHANDAAFNVLSGCQVLSRCHATAPEGRGFAIYLIGCDHAQAVSEAATAQCMIFGGVLRGTLTLVGGASVLDGSVVLHGALTISTGAFANLAEVFSDSSVLVQNGGTARMSAPQGTGGVTSLWGSCSVQVQAQSAFLALGTFTTQVLTNGAFTLGGVATGTSYTPATGLWASAVALSKANIDAAGGLQNPITGARYSTAA